MMRQTNNSQPKGCFQNIIYLLYVAIFTILAAYSLFVLGPQLERQLELNVCQAETIVEKYNGRGKAKTVICVDKNTGRKIAVSSYQYFQICPTALIIFIAIICGLFLGLFLRIANKNKD